MNYLGHLYFSNNDPDRMINNLFGDFVKGKDLSRFSENIIRGITLHRQIDHYIDTHPAIHELNRTLYPQLPKVAPIAVDLYFDFLLASNWSKFHPVDLNLYINQFYEVLEKTELPNEIYGPRFVAFKFALLRYKWLSFYHSEYGLDKMCVNVGKKIQFPNQLYTGLQVFHKNKAAIEKAFFNYMEDAIFHFKIHD